MDTLVRPTVLYGFEVWELGLLESDWSLTERVQIILHHIIRCKHIIRQPIVLVEFVACPFRLETVYGLMSLLHCIQSFADTTKGKDWYPFLAYCSSESIALASSLIHSHCWYVGVSVLLVLVGITMDRLPPFRYSLDALGHLLPTRQEMNTIIIEDIYRKFVWLT
jgi:hypothetical protein